MASKNLQGDFQAYVDVLLKGLAVKLESADRQLMIRQALDTYSNHKPNTYTASVTGDGGFDYTINTTNFPSYEDGWSKFKAIEYPYDSGAADPNWLEDEDWTIYEGTSSTKYLRFLNATPSATETFRAVYTIPYAFDASGNVTIPATDFRAICKLAASYCLEAIASALIHTGDSTIQADAVNYRSKPREALDLAKAYLKDYEKHMGLAEDGSAPGVSLTKEWDTEFSFQSDFLTHPARWR